MRAFKELDISAATDIAVRGMEFDYWNEALIREKTFGSLDFDPELSIAVDGDGVLAGFAQGAVGVVAEGKLRGYVRLLMVSPAARRKGIGSQLLTEMEKRLKSKGVELVSIMDSPLNYFTPGVDFRYTAAYCFLLKHKYETYRENHNLRCELHPDMWPDLDTQVAAFQQDGFWLRRALSSDREATFKFLDTAWPSWKHEVGGSLDNDPCTLYIAGNGDEVIAFSGYQGNNKALPWFGPMGTSTELRGKGIGAILLRLCLRDMARQGWQYSIIPWVGPVAFYARFCDAKIDRCFWAYRKELG